MAQERRIGPYKLVQDDADIFRRALDEFYSFAKLRGSPNADVWAPPTDVYETSTHVVVKMCVPGVSRDSVRVSFRGDVLTISGYRGAAPEPRLVAYHQMEIRNGYFQRRVAIRIPIDPEQTSAQYHDGFLWVRIPKAQRLSGGSFTIRVSI